ncbi:MAG: galactose mutarotase, partial [Rhodobacteraceae bacterium]|nr:galactose mutarotase [Paracoccaceae bacterium]
MSNLQVGVSSFGLTPKGDAVQNIVLESGGLTASVLTFGAILQGVWLEGVDHSLTLGSDRLEDYFG